MSTTNNAESPAEPLVKPRKKIWERSIERVCRTMSFVGVIFLVAVVALTVVDVLLRSIFNRPILGSTEITEYMMILLLFGAGAAALAKRQIQMELLMEHFSARTQAVVETITNLITLGVFGVMSYYTFVEAFALKDLGLTSGALKIPTWPIYFLLALGLAIICLSLVVLTKNSILKAKER
jgi:TRAP-type C4-dicarboxylate transport system permease small subunit